MLKSDNFFTQLKWNACVCVCFWLAKRMIEESDSTSDKKIIRKIQKLTYFKYQTNKVAIIDILTIDIVEFEIFPWLIADAIAFNRKIGP